MGKDYDNVKLMWERLKEFERENEEIGSERVDDVNGIDDKIISESKYDYEKIEEWKDGINEEWKDMIEIIEKRKKMIDE